MKLREQTRSSVWTGTVVAALVGLIAALPGGATATPAAALGDRSQTCVPHQIHCGSTVTGTLTDDDCFLRDFLPTGAARYFDPWILVDEVTAGTTLTIDMTSNQFDTYLLLTDEESDCVEEECILAEDDDGGEGTNSHLVHTLDFSGDVGILAAGYNATALGDYTLSLTCDEGPDPETLSLLGGRFRITVDWLRPNGRAGTGTAVPFTDQAGLFYFFSEDNLEMLIKMLDGCSLNGNYWLFYAATTNVEFTVTVTDTVVGNRLHFYHNPQGTAALPVQDTHAFTCP